MQVEEVVVAMRGKLWVMCGAFRLLHMRVFDMLVLTCFPKTGRCLSTLLSATVNIQTECQRTLAWCPGCASHGVKLCLAVTFCTPPPSNPRIIDRERVRAGKGALAASPNAHAGCLLSRGRQHQTPLLRVVDWCYLTI